MTSFNTAAKIGWDNAAKVFSRHKKSDIPWNFILKPALYRLIDELPIRGASALDAGCGFGDLVKYLDTKSCTATGVDWSGEMIACAREYHPTGTFIQSDIEKSELLSFPGAPFDIIFSINVLMDHENIKDSIRNFSLSLKPGGYLICTFKHPEHTARRVSDPSNAAPFFTTFLGDNTPTLCMHRPLSDYYDAFAQANLSVQRFFSLSACAEAIPKTEFELLRKRQMVSNPIFAVALLQAPTGKKEYKGEYGNIEMA